MNVSLLQVVSTIMDPFGIVRRYFLRPAIAKTKANVSSAKALAFRAVVLLFAFVVLLWTATFLYLAFYYSFIPPVSHSRPVHMQYKACEHTPGLCSFPAAHVSLTKKQQLLMVGQPYRILVNIEMPESPNNQNLGMFLVCAEMRDRSTNLRGHSCRSAMLHYKSSLQQWITTWIVSPLLVLGWREEKQQVPIELFSSYEDDQQFPVTDVYVEIQSKQIQFYSVSLHITAHFTGLRYFMFHWPLLSATIGISTNLFFILIVCLLSYYHWSESEWIEEAKERIKSKLSPSRPKLGSETGSGDMSTSAEDSKILDEEEDISVIEELGGSSKEGQASSTSLLRERKAKSSRME